MCGLAGFINPPDCKWNSTSKEIAIKMARQLSHRGPDAEGVWTDRLGVALAHRRLSIIDLTDAGSQPMVSHSGRYILVFNGEIYNHHKIRSELEKTTWFGYSDTETFLEAIETWGVKKALEASVGMFSFALWDQKEGTLTLARDRFGEKPLFFGWQRKSFLFGSELKALAKHPAWDGEINRDALSSYIQYGYVPTPSSIWKGIFKLNPGSFLTFEKDTPVGKLPNPVFYWQAANIANLAGQSKLNEKQAIDKLDMLLKETLNGQKVSDVPIGAFLSGGIDSSSIVAVMQSISAQKVNTFSIGFSEIEYNEADHAKVISKFLGTDHTDLYVTPKDARDIIPKLPSIYDEPFADASQIPTFLLSRMTQKHVKVALTGDGGDELFGGYNRHLLVPKIWKCVQWLPTSIRHLIANKVTYIKPQQWDLAYSLIAKGNGQQNIGEKIHKVAKVLMSENLDEAYLNLVTQESNPHSILAEEAISAKKVSSWAETEMDSLKIAGFTERMLFNDQVGYLNDDILCKVDRAAMAASLETRAPFLDHRIAEFAWSLPLNFKIRGRESKWILRQLLFNYIPKDLLERPKQGFAVPIGVWLKGPLREWAEDLLNESRLKNEGYFNSKNIIENWRLHLSGEQNLQYWLWNILMFQAWKDEWIKN